MPMRTRTSVLIILAIAIAGVGAFAATHKTASPPTPAAPPPVPVVAGKVSSQDVPIYLRGIGTVIAYNTDVVRSQIQGQLTRIAFTEGQTVRAGDLLAQIDPRPFQVQLDQVTDKRGRSQLETHQRPAPISGITGVRQIDVGNIINQTDANGLLVLTHTEPITLTL